MRDLLRHLLGRPCTRYRHHPFLPVTWDRRCGYFEGPTEHRCFLPARCHCDG